MKKRLSRKQKQKGGGISVTIDGITFTLLGKTLGDPLSWGSKDYIHLTNGEETFCLYRSKSEGMWRFACFDSDILYKGEDYITKTFVHIDLQTFICEHLHLVPDVENVVKLIQPCRMYPSLSAQTMTTPKEFRELAKIKCGVIYEELMNPVQGQTLMLSKTIQKLKEDAIAGKNDVLVSIIDRYMPAFDTLLTYKDRSQRQKELDEEGSNELLDWKNNYHIVASDALRSLYGILSSYVQEIMTVHMDTFKFLFSFHHDLFTNVTLRKEKRFEEHADILFNVYSVDVSIGGAEYTLICAKYRYTYKDERMKIVGSDEYTCVINLVPKTTVTKFGLYSDVITIGNYICKILEYKKQVLIDLQHLHP